MSLQTSEGTVLVVGDDAELGGLIALNLRLRGLVVEHTNPSLALEPRWSPSFGTPDLLVADVESADSFTPTRLHHLLERPWARGVRLILAADKPEPFVRVLSSAPNLLLRRPDDVGAIVNAVRALLRPVVPTP
jgi:DNA-binding response OmpR family regulator